MQDRMVFLVGPPRSGSTLLMRVLNATSEIYSRPEPHIMAPLAHLGFWDVVEKAPYDQLQSQQAMREFVKDLPGDEAVGHQGVDCAGLRERLDLLGRGGPKPPALQHCHRGFGSLVLELTRASTIASWVFCISGSPQASLLMMMEKASSSASALTP